MFLEPKYNAVLTKYGLEGIVPFDTKVVASAKGRPAEKDEWQVTGLDVEWDKIYEKFVSWADPSRPGRLKLELWFNFNTQQSSSSNRAKRGARTHTERQLLERAEFLREGQVLSGSLYPWTKSCEFYKCTFSRRKNSKDTTAGAIQSTEHTTHSYHTAHWWNKRSSVR